MADLMEYWFSVNITTLIILSLVMAETFCKSNEGNTLHKCYQESAFNDSSENCSDCKTGYFGSNCSQRCRFPYFGDGCQQKCNCLEEECDFSIGCSNNSTTMYIITSVFMPTMDNKTVEMDNKTVEISTPKETLFPDTLGSLFNTNTMSIMVVSGVSLILITLMIVFAYKLIRKRYSKRRILNCHNEDSIQEPVQTLKRTTIPKKKVRVSCENRFV